MKSPSNESLPCLLSQRVSQARHEQRPRAPGKALESVRMRALEQPLDPVKLVYPSVS